MVAAPYFLWFNSRQIGDFSEPAGLGVLYDGCNTS